MVDGGDVRRRLTLVLGGVRAGKSSYAQQLAAAGRSVLFVATAEAGDSEMAERIRAHQASRPSDWHTLEEPLHLAAALEPVLHRYDTVLLDCLTLWVSNLLLRADDPWAARDDALAQAQALLDLQARSEAAWVVVSNETGLGVIPPTPLGRAFQDALGRVNQLVAAHADDVYFMVAGLPVPVKPPDAP